MKGRNRNAKNVEKIEFYLNFASDRREIGEPLSRKMQELPPLVDLCVRTTRQVNELQDKGPPRANIGTPWEEIPTHKRLKDAGLPAALATDNGDLRKVDGGRTSQLSKDVLQPIDDGYDRVAQRVRRSRSGLLLLPRCPRSVCHRSQ